LSDNACGLPLKDSINIRGECQLRHLSSRRLWNDALRTGAGIVDVSVGGICCCCHFQDLHGLFPLITRGVDFGKMNGKMRLIGGQSNHL
jgi:hypothetical protein